jgi:hypothetical protein
MNLSVKKLITPLCRYCALCLPYVALFAIVLCMPSRSVAQLLVGTGFSSSSNSIVVVNTTIPQVQSTFGDAINFDPAPGAMVQDSLGRVYVIDTNNERVRRFDHAGHFIDYFITSGFYANGLTWGMAIDAAGNIYIASDGANLGSAFDDAIVRYSSSGTFLGTFGQASNAASGFIGGGPLAFDSQGNLYSSSSGRILRYSPNGTALGVFANAFPASMAFDSQGILYDADGDILRFSPTGAPLGTFASGEWSSVAFDGQGNLFAASITQDKLGKFNPSGTLLATINLSGPGNMLFLVPEPATIILFFIAAAGLCSWPRRKT